MDRTSISRRIGSIKGDIEKLSNTLCAIEKTDIENYPDNYAMLTTDAALRSELIACRMRHLLYGSTATRKETYLASAGVVQGIRIKAQENMLEITLPCLLPKRKQRQSTEFLIDPLYFTLSQYSDNNELPKFRQCVVCFSHIYSEKFHNRRVRDYDNLELKQLLDVLSTFIMVDDTGLLVDAYNTTEIGEADCTRISVMAKEDFPKWLNEREKSLKTISDFERLVGENFTIRCGKTKMPVNQGFFSRAKAEKLPGLSATSVIFKAKGGGALCAAQTVCRISRRWATRCLNLLPYPASFRPINSADSRAATVIS